MAKQCGRLARAEQVVNDLDSGGERPNWPCPAGGVPNRVPITGVGTGTVGSPRGDSVARGRAWRGLPIRGPHRGTADTCFCKNGHEFTQRIPMSARMGPAGYAGVQHRADKAAQATAARGVTEQEPGNDGGRRSREAQRHGLPAAARYGGHRYRWPWESVRNGRGPCPASRARRAWINRHPE